MTMGNVLPGKKYLTGKINEEVEKISITMELWRDIFSP